MNRLTHKYLHGGYWASIFKVSACGENECKGEIIDRLAEYENAEEQGLIVRLQCKPGDTVYTNVHALDGCLPENIKPPYPGVVLAVELAGDITNGYGAIKVMFPDFSLIKFNFSDIGKTVFLTKEDAEKALAESEGKANE